MEVISEVPGRRLVQVRLDDCCLFLSPKEAFKVFPGELLGVWRELSKKSKTLHYHALFISDDKLTKKQYEPFIKQVTKSNTSRSSKCVKFYSSRNFANGESFQYYIGYCSKCNDPIIDYPDSDLCRKEYERVNVSKSNDAEFKGFIAKRLHEGSQDHEIDSVICDWYQQQGTQHNVLICDQRFWQVQAFINPTKHKERMMSAMSRYRNKMLS